MFKPLSVPEEFLQRYGLNRQGIYLLYVGSDNPRKNLRRLIEAFAQVHDSFPDVQLIKVGTSENLVHARLHREEVTRMGLEHCVHWLDQVPEADLPYFYNLARVFIFPSLYEGFGLPPLESMACGTPVVCSNAASLPEVVGDAALLVDPYDVAGIAKAVRRILTEDDLAKGLCQRGLIQALKFSWRQTALKTVEVYQKLAGC